MKRSFTSFGLSALLHGGLLALLAPLLWPTVHTPLNQPATIKLTLSQFQTPVAFKEIATTPQPVTETSSTQIAELSKPNISSPKPANLTPQAAIPKAFITKPKESPKPREKPQIKPEPKPLPPKNIKPEAVKPPTATPELQQNRPVIQPTVKPSVVNKTEQPNPVLARPPLKPAVAPVAQPERLGQSAAPATTRVPPRPVPLTGVTPPTSVAPANPAAEAAYRRRMQALIDARKQYPVLAEKAEVEGSVTVAFTVLANGAITNANVVKSSGNQWLDNGAVQAVKAASGVLPFPTELRKTQLGLTIVVHYRLE